jgi:uncharacterized membrane protein YeaQ/YmgE (transglycosylase-associated protein family)
MTILELFVVLLVAGIIGVIGQAIAGVTRGGCLISIVLGFIGGLIGVWLSRTLNLPDLLTIQVGEVDFPLFWSIIGTALFVAIIGWLTRRSSRF